MEIEIRGRSGMNSVTGLRMVPGTIDWDFRGEVQVVFDNLSDEAYIIEPG
jgi:dUTPase